MPSLRSKIKGLEYKGYIGKDDGDKICKAIEQADKYRWHDLRKNAEDLPEEGSEVIVCFPNGSHRVDYYRSDLGFNSWKVIAWKYIQPFESEE